MINLMHTKELNLLPSDIARLIYLRMYYPWVLAELSQTRPEDNSFVVRDSHSKSHITEIDVPLGRLFLNDLEISNLYRLGVSTQPSDIWEFWCQDHSPTFTMTSNTQRSFKWITSILSCSGFVATILVFVGSIVMIKT
jgi:hypothetical protein